MEPYVLDDASKLEYQRLDLMSKILDPWTRGYFTALGVGEGWQCLELGSGNGSIAEWLSETVSPSGNVTAIDINPVLLELIPAQNLTVRQMDVRTSSGLDDDSGVGTQAASLNACQARPIYPTA
jgi:tRNA A58 N-methylase Trm61